MHRFEAYLEAVESGERVAGLLERKAVERHRRDLLEGPHRGLTFDLERAQYAVDFCECLRHTKGRWAGEPFELQAWQVFVVGSLFGWIHAETGLRRFRQAYAELAKKNGKSTMAGAVALLLAGADGEAEAEVYSVATKRDQARIVFEAGRRMARATPGMSDFCRVLVRSVVFPHTGSFFQPLSADADAEDGINVHGAILDELHRWKTDDLLSMLENSVAARTQPLVFAITTAGAEIESPCGDMHDYSTRVLLGGAAGLSDDAFFAFVCNLDEGDDWTNPAVWPKANPSWGVSVDPEELGGQVSKAIESPRKQNHTRRLRLNVWCDDAESAMDVGTWDRNAGELTHEELPEALVGRECFGGLDLAKSIDCAAYVLAFPPEIEGERVQLLTRIYMPEDVCRDPERIATDRVPWDVWAERGWIRATPGDVIDFAHIRRDLVADSDLYTVRQVAYDRYAATQLVTQLQEDDGLEMVPTGQGYVSMAFPCLEFEKLTTASRLAHGGHPVLRWMALNLVFVTDDAGNRKPSRRRSRKKIDGLVALLMALDRLTRNEEGPGPGHYATGGDLLGL